jgi:hypothetical protein
LLCQLRPRRLVATTITTITTIIIIITDKMAP